MLGLIKSIFVSRDVNLWKTVDNTYIRPHLEFAIRIAPKTLTSKKTSVFWNMFQRRAAKIPHATKLVKYKSCMEMFNITTLIDYRTREDLTFYGGISNYFLLPKFITKFAFRIFYFLVWSNPSPIFRMFQGWYTCS